ncbi:unnamed protein product [Sphagnum troendelagicum]|uniref:Chlororespiratory reduction 3 n=1 Tax=Sphagnum troendelagicum TaxID=128251 RepID=A0ABP0UPE2_9BRYO
MVVAMAPIIPLPLHVVSPQVQSNSSPVLPGSKMGSRPALVSCTAVLSPGKSSEGGAGAHHNSLPPKMEPFSRSRISRLMREPSLLEKAEQALSDRCMVLEGDEGYRCWEALSEFENIKVVLQSRNLCSIMLLQPLVVPSCGVSGLIDNVIMVAKVAKLPHGVDKPLVLPEAGEPLNNSMEEETKDDSGLLPESLTSQMLRHQGRPAPWFTHPPDHSPVSI